MIVYLALSFLYMKLIIQNVQEISQLFPFAQTQYFSWGVTQSWSRFWVRHSSWNQGVGQWCGRAVGGTMMLERPSQNQRGTCCPMANRKWKSESRGSWSSREERPLHKDWFQCCLHMIDSFAPRSLPIGSALKASPFHSLCLELLWVEHCGHASSWYHHGVHGQSQILSLSHPFVKTTPCFLLCWKLAIKILSRVSIFLPLPTHKPRRTQTEHYSGIRNSLRTKRGNYFPGGYCVPPLTGSKNPREESILNSLKHSSKGKRRQACFNHLPLVL